MACACTILNECYKVPGLQLRIGIHLGDIVIENGDAFGDSVNIAARLQALAPINGIWLSEAVFKNVLNKKGIEASFVKEETLKNVREPVRIYEVNFKTFSPQQFMSTTASDSRVEFLGEKGQKKELKREEENKFCLTSKDRPSFTIKSNGKRTIIGACILLLLAWPAYKFYGHWKRVERAKKELLPEIQKLTSTDYFFNSPKAYELAKEAELIIPNDSALLLAWPKFSSKISIYTTPSDANVYWKDYGSSDDQWVLLGKTPLEKIWIPNRFPEIKLQKKGFATVLNPPIFRTAKLQLILDSLGKYPINMVKVPGSVSRMRIVGLEQYEGQFIGDFLMDKFEVTNKDFKVFVDSGGYKRKLYWDYPFYANGKEITWEQAMNLFKDKTGQQGPATWEAGSYPDGKSDHPVTGVSWYEALAYAKFVRKQVPTVYHWSQVADTFNTWDILPNSNFNGTGTVAVGKMKGVSWWGVNDIGGNAREWCFNASGEHDIRYILGGGWNDPSYAFNNAGRQSAIDRSPSNGFRCMQKLPGDTSFDKLAVTLALDSRDYKKEEPVDDKTFLTLFREFNYDHSPFNDTMQIIADSDFVRVEKIEIDAAYNNERLTIYLFLPNNVSPPFQTILFYPGSNGLRLKNYDYYSDLRFLEYFIKSGRAVAYPIVKSAFERSDSLKSDRQKETVLYKQHVVAWRQDYERTLDYLDGRKDIIHNNYAYFGWSWGSSIAPVICAMESRYKAIVLHVGGLQMQKTFPEVDPLNFLPRVITPLLLLTGANDSFFPVETSQKPFFALVGSKAKEMKTFPGGHFVPVDSLVKESLNWYDKYLGAAK